MAAVVLSKRPLRSGRGRKLHRGARHPHAQYAVDRLRRVRERQLGESDQVTVDLERVQVHVTEAVTRLVIARVERGSGRAAPDRRLLRGLADLGAGEKTAGRDTGPDECLVITAPGELRVLVRLAD